MNFRSIKAELATALTLASLVVMSLGFITGQMVGKTASDVSATGTKAFYETCRLGSQECGRNLVCFQVYTNQEISKMSASDQEITKNTGRCIALSNIANNCASSTNKQACYSAPSQGITTQSNITSPTCYKNCTMGSDCGAGYNCRYLGTNTIAPDKDLGGWRCAPIGRPESCGANKAIDCICSTDQVTPKPGNPSPTPVNQAAKSTPAVKGSALFSQGYVCGGNISITTDPIVYKIEVLNPKTGASLFAVEDPTYPFPLNLERKPKSIQIDWGSPKAGRFADLLITYGTGSADPKRGVHRFPLPSSITGAEDLTIRVYYFATQSGKTVNLFQDILAKGGCVKTPSPTSTPTLTSTPTPTVSGTVSTTATPTPSPTPSRTVNACYGNCNNDASCPAGLACRPYPCKAGQSCPAINVCVNPTCEFSLDCKCGVTPTSTPTPTPTSKTPLTTTPTKTPTPTNTLTPTKTTTPTKTPTPTNTLTATKTPTPTPTRNILTSTQTPTPSNTATPSPSPTPSVCEGQVVLVVDATSTVNSAGRLGEIVRILRNLPTTSKYQLFSFNGDFVDHTKGKFVTAAEIESTYRKQITTRPGTNLSKAVQNLRQVYDSLSTRADFIFISDGIMSRDLQGCRFDDSATMSGVNMDPTNPKSTRRSESCNKIYSQAMIEFVDTVHQNLGFAPMTFADNPSYPFPRVHSAVISYGSPDSFNVKVMDVIRRHGKPSSSDPAGYPGKQIIDFDEAPGTPDSVQCSPSANTSSTLNNFCTKSERKLQDLITSIAPYTCEKKAVITKSAYQIDLGQINASKDAFTDSSGATRNDMCFTVAGDNPNPGRERHSGPGTSNHCIGGSISNYLIRDASGNVTNISTKYKNTSKNTLDNLGFQLNLCANAYTDNSRRDFKCDTPLDISSGANRVINTLSPLAPGEELQVHWNSPATNKWAIITKRDSKGAIIKECNYGEKAPAPLCNISGTNDIVVASVSSSQSILNRLLGKSTPMTFSTLNNKVPANQSSSSKPTRFLMKVLNNSGVVLANTQVEICDATNVCQYFTSSQNVLPSTRAHFNTRIKDLSANSKEAILRCTLRFADGTIKKCNSKKIDLSSPLSFTVSTSKISSNDNFTPASQEDNNLDGEVNIAVVDPNNDSECNSVDYVATLLATSNTVNQNLLYDYNDDKVVDSFDVAVVQQCLGFSSSNPTQ